MNTYLRSYTLDQILEVASQLKSVMDRAAIITFTGQLGAGKTTLISALLKQCGVTQPITSPTFTYVNRYENSQGQVFYHFDLYRIGSIDEFIMAGFNEYLYQQDSWALIEWPEVIRPLIDHSVCNVMIEYKSNYRTIEYTLIP